MSCDRSNVVEKCFAHAERRDRSMLMEEVLGKENERSSLSLSLVSPSSLSVSLTHTHAHSLSQSPLVGLVKDQYANYVVQKMIDVVDEDQRIAVLRVLFSVLWRSCGSRPRPRGGVPSHSSVSVSVCTCGLLGLILSPSQAL